MRSAISTRMGFAPVRGAMSIANIGMSSTPAMRGSCQGVMTTSECITRKATPDELAILEKELGPVKKNKQPKGGMLGYWQQMNRPHKVVPRTAAQIIEPTMDWLDDEENRK